MTLIESTIGLLIHLGLFTKSAGIVGALDGLGLTLTFSFCSCPWVVTDFPLTFWFYFSSLLLNIQLLFDRSSDSLGVSGVLTRLVRKGRSVS